MDKIPIPITYNAYKHHLQFLKKQIEKWKKEDWEEVLPELNYLGENLLDFYIGEIPVKKICNECLSYFQKRNIHNLQLFNKWLGTEKYRKIKLSDSSEWVIKLGIHPERYIHIHPAKYSRHTIRIRSLTLKTVVALEIHSAVVQKSLKCNLQQINQVRKNYLHLSPIKSISFDKGIFKIWRLFEEECIK